VRAINRDEHLAFIVSRPSASHMQVPSWGEVKPDWRAESLGWFDGEGRLGGVGLVLLRPLPKLKRYLAYLPEGPVIDWFDPELEARWLDPMLAYLKAQGAFSVKMGPPVVVRRWSADAVKAAIADPAARSHVSSVAARSFTLMSALWSMPPRTPCGAESSRFLLWAVPLQHAGLTGKDLFKGPSPCSARCSCTSGLSVTRRRQVRKQAAVVYSHWRGNLSASPASRKPKRLRLPISSFCRGLPKPGFDRSASWPKRQRGSCGSGVGSSW
jgi:hypothetical protein